MDYYERQQDRADNRRERTERDEDFAFEQRHQLQLGSNTTRRSTPDAAVQANELYGISPRAQRKVEPSGLDTQSAHRRALAGYWNSRCVNPVSCAVKHRAVSKGFLG